MPDFKKMTVETLRELARKTLGPGHSKKSKSELIAALEGTGGKAAAAREPGARAQPPGRSAAAGRATKTAKAAVRKAGEAAREGAKAVARAGKAAAAAGKAAAAGASQGVKASRTREKKPGKVGSAVATVAGAAAGAVAGIASSRRSGKGTAKTAKEAGEPKAKATKPPRSQENGQDPEGFFVARVRGEDALRDAPHPMAEAAGDGWSEAEEAVGPAVYQEHLGDLPWGYGDDAFVALARDPRTLFLYWDWGQDTLSRGFEGLEHPRTQLWVFARAAQGWERVRIADFALEARGYYVHDLVPGRVYRAEIHVVDRGGRERVLGTSSNECGLPPVGPSPVIDDRFVRIPWELALGQLLGPGHAGGPFSDDARALLARLSDWSRFSGPTWGSSAGGMGGRPSSPTSSPSGPFGGGER